MGDETSAPPRKMMFKPKLPPRKVLKSEAKIEPTETKAEDGEWQKLVKIQEGFGNKGPKTEKKIQPVQVAFGYGSGRSFVVPKRASTAAGANSDEFSAYGARRVEKEYVEPWDYHSYYPVTLPLRKPYAGNPEHLDEEEFGQASTNLDYDEDKINPAAVLGLMEETEEEQILFFHLPDKLPISKTSASLAGKEVAEDSKQSQVQLSSERACKLKGIPAGVMGKLQVYRSGAVKLKLGDVLYDVSPGLQSIFAEDAAVVYPKEKLFCVLGDIKRHSVLTPDIDSLVDGICNLN